MKAKTVLFMTISLFFFAGMGCGKEKETVLSTVKISETVSTFFETHLPLTSKSPCFFGEDNSDKFFVINTLTEFQSYFLCNEELPDINFKQYSLVIGQKQMPNSFYKVINQKIVITSKTMEMNIEAAPLSDGIWTATSTMYYWGIYSKLPNTKMIINIKY